MACLIFSGCFGKSLIGRMKENLGTVLDQNLPRGENLSVNSKDPNLNRKSRHSIPWFVLRIRALPSHWMQFILVFVKGMCTNTMSLRVNEIANWDRHIKLNGEERHTHSMNVHCASDWECSFGSVALFHRIRFPFSACVPFNGILMHLCLWSFRAASTARHALQLFFPLGDDCRHFRHIPNSCNNTTMSLVKDGVATPELMYGRNFKEIAARMPDSCNCVARSTF